MGKIFILLLLALTFSSAMASEASERLEQRFSRVYQEKVCNTYNPETDYLLTYPGTNRLEELVQNKIEDECRALAHESEMVPKHIELKRLSITKTQDGPVKCKEGVFRVTFSCRETENLFY